MKILIRTKFTWSLLIYGALYVVSACGVDNSTKYPDKNFGKNIEDETSDDLEEVDLSDDLSSPSSQTPKTANKESSVDNGDSSEAPKTTDDAGPVNSEDEAEVVEPAPKEVKIAHYKLKGYFDTQSLRLLSNNDDGSGNGLSLPVCNGNLNQYYCLVDNWADWVVNPVACTKKKICESVRGYITEMLGEPDETLEMNIYKTTTAGLNRIERTISTATGDRMAAKHKKANQSGNEILDWNSDDPRCPYQFGCIERVIFKPKFSSLAPNAGRSKTFCYYSDHSGNDSVPIPASPLPIYTQEDFIPVAKIYGPYFVKKYDGVVNCKEPPLDSEVEFTQEIWIEVGLSTSIMPPMKYHRKNRLPYDFVIEMNTFKNEEKKAQRKFNYIDRARLASNSKYYINSEAQTVVKASRTVQSPLELDILGWVESGLSWLLTKEQINYFKSYLYVDGMQIDVHWEHCQNKLFEEGSHCVE